MVLPNRHGKNQRSSSNTTDYCGAIHVTTFTTGKELYGLSEFRPEWPRSPLHIIGAQPYQSFIFREMLINCMWRHRNCYIWYENQHLIISWRESLKNWIMLVWNKQQWCHPFGQKLFQRAKFMEANILQKCEFILTIIIDLFIYM